MNSNWKNLLLAENAVFENDTDIVFPEPEPEAQKQIYPLAHLGVITISGVDAAKFLQGQITCNINDLSDIKSSLGAICNPKGRAVAIFLLVKKDEAFLMILPQELLSSVQKRLQMYVLRSKVTLTDSSDELCLIGLSHEQLTSGETAAPLFATSRQKNIVVNLNNRSLIISEVENAQSLWLEQLKLRFQPESTAQWRCLDILSGIPWLTAATSEEFIPQMLNLDKLGGISFTKGCYTGQEIVARTHYLGKAKREMFVAECNALMAPEPNSIIIDDSSGTEQSIGRVLSAEIRKNSCKMLVVLQVSDTNTYNLKLQNYGQVKVALLTL
jgi:folate-binding protein YgfZ